MKILHTSDWHLGRSLYGKKRDQEHRAFLAWLIETIDKEQVDVVIVAGDVFDTTTPSHTAQALYYDFLCQVATTTCQHVVVIAGNHDSPSFINAPKALLAALGVHVVGQACTDPADEVLVLKDKHDQPALIVCAVPFLRDKDIRKADVAESIEEKAQSQIKAIQQHYEAVALEAERLNAQWDNPVPVVATGHLFTAGGTQLADDGVRDLYVGNLGHLSVALFPTVFDYVALGHLHVPQRVANKEHIRYCGSPIPIGFSEHKQQKLVCLVQFEPDQTTEVTELPIPRFQELARVTGQWESIKAQIEALVAHSTSIWLEVEYTGSELMPDLREQLEDLTASSALEILRIKNQWVVAKTLEQTAEQNTLDQLSELEVFQRCLVAHEVAESQHLELTAAYQEILQTLYAKE